MGRRQREARRGRIRPRERREPAWRVPAWRVPVWRLAKWRLGTRRVRPPDRVTPPAWTVLAALVLVSPFLRALAFPREQLLAGAVLLAAAALWLVFVERRRRAPAARAAQAAGAAGLPDTLDWLALLVAVAYLLSTMVAVNPRAALQEDLKVLSYAAAFWLARRAAVPGTPLAWAFVLSGVVQVGFGLAVRAGWASWQDAWLGERLAAALQYPNALGAYLGAGLLVALGLALGSGRAATGGGATGRGEADAAGGAAVRGGAAERAAVRGAAVGQVAAVVAAAALLGGFLLTYSRGAWLSLPVGAAVLAAGLRRARRAVFAPAGEAAVPAARRGEGSAARREQAAAAAGGATAGGDAVRRRGRVRAVAGVVLAAGALAALVALPPVRGRLAQVGMDDYSTWSRVQFTRDALSMWRDRPVLGAGGGAWDATYLAYQSYGYWTAQAHNQPVQVLVETGVVGFAAWLAFWAAVAALAWRRLGATGRAPSGAAAGGDGAAGAPAAVGEAVRPPVAVGEVAGPLAAVVFLLLHSVGDFHLALGAVSLPLWILAGVAAGPPARAADERGGAAGLPRRPAELPTGHAGLPPRPAGFTTGPTGLPALAGLLAVAAALAVILAAALAAGERAARSFEEGDFLAAEDGLRRAARLDPLAAPFRADLAQVELARADVGLEADLALAERLAREAVARDRYNPGFHALLAEVLERRGRPDEALAELKRAAELHPYSARRWEALAQAAVRAAEAASRVEAGRAAGEAADPAVARDGEGARDGAAVRRYAAVAEEAAREMARRAKTVPAIVPPDFRLPPTTAALEQARARLRVLAGG